jgi:demethylmenaquinone methyltransferase/2-methoxy-6-polyprenyl-1,4-benzoquinol methylase
MTDNKTTHFGFKTVPVQEKAGHVADVFHSVAGKYDLMN